MKRFNKGVLLAVAFSFSFGFPVSVLEAATTPSLGSAATFGILSYTYINNSPVVTITGDLGYTVGPSTAPSVSGVTHINNATYTQAVNDQNAALAALNSQPCTFTFTAGTIDLVTDSSHGPVGVYAPGVYCINGSMTVGGGGTITLNGAGTFIFRPTGALTTSDLSRVSVVGGSACDIFWTPGGSTILGTSGMGSTFVGTVLEPIGAVVKDITVNEGIYWVGRALNGTIGTLAHVTTGIDVTITRPTCGAQPATLRVIKTVENEYGGTATPSDFNLYVRLSGVDVAGSPAAGVSSPGRTYTLTAPNDYVISEDPSPGYTAQYSGACGSDGSITLAPGDDKTCTVSNTENPPASPPPATLHIIKHVVNDEGGTAVASDVTLHVKKPGFLWSTDVAGSPSAGSEAPGTSYVLEQGTYTVTENAFPGYTQSFSGDCDASGKVVLAPGDDKTCTVTNDDIANPPPSGKDLPATLRVVKRVINDDGGTAIPYIFTMHVKDPGFFGSTDVAGSPSAGSEAPGTSYLLPAGTYVVSEGASGGYTQSFSGDCDASGKVVLAPGDDKTCTVTNDDEAKSTVIPKLPNTGVLFPAGFLEGYRYILERFLKGANLLNI